MKLSSPHQGNAVDLGSEALASHESGEDESSLPKNNAHYKIDWFGLS